MFMEDKKLILQDAKLGIDYEVLGIDLPKESVKHLSHLGADCGKPSTPCGKDQKQRHHDVKRESPSL